MIADHTIGWVVLVGFKRGERAVNMLTRAATAGMNIFSIIHPTVHRVPFP